MTTRKPFSIRTQNELNISNKTNEEKAEKRNMASKKQTTKIIKVNTKTNSKIYINKKDNNGDIKLVSGNTNALLAPSIEPSVEGVQQKKIADDIENAPPTMNDKEVRVDQPHDEIISKNEEPLSSVGIFLGKEGSVMRNTYSIHQLLKMEPKVNTKPIGFENWPEELRNPKPREIKTPIKKNNGNNKPNSVFKKRSPSGESSPLVVNITSNINNATKCIEQSNILEKFNIAANENNGIITKDTTNVAQIQPVQFIPVQTLKPLLIEKTTVASPSSPLKLDLTPIKNTSHIETDDRRLDQRQKQIDLGKKTLSYYMYCKKVPIFERKKGCPVTPRKNQICSKRSWDGQVRKWRRMLHDYDPKSTEEIEEAMRLFPDETKYLLQKRQEELEGKTTSNDDKEKDEENFD